MENKQQTLEAMVNAEIPVIEKYKQFAIYHNAVHHLIQLKNIFKKDWIEINRIADCIIQEEKIFYKENENG